MARDRVGRLIGEYKCWSCGETVPVRKKSEDAGAGLGAPCPWCGFPHYAKRGTEHYDNLLRQVKLKAAAEASAEPPKQEEASAPPAAPAPAAPNDRSADKPPKRSFTTPLFGR